jgi:hypothetical protein
LPDQTAISTTAPQVRTKQWHFYWLCGLILSFSYEKPLLYLTSYDRTNPRLFDVFAIIGIIVALQNRQSGTYVPVSYQYWKTLVLWFCVCAVVWSVSSLLPFEYARFSIFFAGMYLVGFFVISCAIMIPINEEQKKILLMVSVFGGVFVAIYCTYEYLTGGTEIQILDDKSVAISEGTLVGPFGVSYFQLVQHQCLSFCMACALAAREKKAFKRLAWGAVALFISWPLFFSGSRTGLALFVVSLLVLFVLNKELRKMLTTIFIFLIIVFAFAGNSIQDQFMSGRTGQRLQDYSDGGNSISSRVSMFQNFDITSYTWSGAVVPFIGAGFYVAPIYVKEVPQYRVDYGFHNIYIFAFEQSGVVGLILFLAFLRYTLKGLSTLRSSGSEIDRFFAYALTAFIIAEMVSGFFGQIFWRGFGTGNFNTYLILMLVLASIPTEKHRSQKI